MRKKSRNYVDLNLQAEKLKVLTNCDKKKTARARLKVIELYKLN